MRRREKRGRDEKRWKEGNGGKMVNGVPKSRQEEVFHQQTIVFRDSNSE